MSRDQQRLADYLAHIAQAIERIGGYIKGMDEQAFMNTPLVQDAVIRNFEVIGEVSNNIDKGRSAQHPPQRELMRSIWDGGDFRLARSV